MQQIVGDVRNLPDKDFNCEPCITDVFYVDESNMGICAVFVQSPDCCVGISHCHIPDDRHSHVRMGLQTK